MKDEKGYIEKERKFRDRSKKRRLSQEEKAAQDIGIKPKHTPYKRDHKNWVNQSEED